MDWHFIAVMVGMAVNVVALLGGLIKLHSIASHVERTFDYFAIEHEILMQDLADRRGIKMDDLPTRLARAPWWPSYKKRHGK